MNAPIGIFTMTPGGTFLFVNPAFARMYGYDSPKQMMAAITDIATQLYADPNDRERFKQMVEKENEALDYESRFIRRDGTLFWGSYSARAVRDDQGTIIHYQGFVSDITERKQTLEVLLKTQFAMDRAADSILWVDFEGHIIYANEAACLSMGYTVDELLNLTVFDIDPDFPRAEWERHKQEVRRHGRMTFESHHRTKDGRIIPVEISTNHFYYQDLFLACAFDRDISARKKVEEELRASEGILRSLLEATAVGVALSKARVFQKVNKAFCRITGYGEEELVGQSARLLYTSEEEYQRVGEALYGMMAREGLGMLEAVIRRKDGELRQVVFSLSPFDPHDSAKGVCATIEDITERKQAEERLRQSERKFRGLVEGLREVIYRMALPNGEYEYISPAAFDVLGYSQETIYASPLLVAKAIHPEYRAFFDQLFANMLRGEVPPVIEYKILDAAGQERWILQSNRGIFDDSGRIVAVEGLCRNITEQKRAEEQLRQSQERLQILSNNLPDSFIYQLLIEPDGTRRFLHVSAGVERVLRVAPAAVLADPDLLYNQFTEESRMRVAEHEAACLASFSGFTIDGYVRRPDGQSRCLNLRSTPHRLPNGTTIWDGMAIDITLRKRNEERLIESERRLNEAQEIAQLGHWFWDVVTGEVEWSEQVFKIFQLDPATFTPRIDSIMALSAPWPEEQKRDQELIQRAIQNREPGRYEQRFLRPDKSIGYYISTFQGKYNDNGALVAIVGTVQDITESKRAEEALRRSEKKLRLAQRIAQLGNWELDLQSKHLSWSDTTYDLFELNPKNFKATYEDFFLAIHPEDRHLVDRAYWQSVEKGTPYEISYRLVMKDGRIKWVNEICRTECDEKGQPLKSYGVFQDITAHKLAEEGLAKEQRRLANILEGTDDGTWEWTVPTGEVIINARWAEMLGYTLEELAPISHDIWIELMHPDDKKTSDALLEEHFQKHTPHYECELRMRHKNGQWVWVLARGKVVEWMRNGQPWLIAGINHDITRRKQIEEQIRHMANHDGLTNLPSMRLAKDRLALAMKMARREQSIAAVMFIDLDGFKAVNDTFGHDVGDLVLRQVAQRLQACVREVDTVARIGGDEFLFIATGLKDKDNAAMIAEKIIRTVIEPIQFNGRQTTVGASIGIALFPPECKDIDNMIKLADQAMYEAKSSREKKYVFADPVH